MTIFLDIETTTPIPPTPEGARFDGHDGMRMACGAVFDGGWRLFGPGQEQDLCFVIGEALDLGRKVVSWNGWAFDYPILWRMKQSAWEEYATAERDLLCDNHRKRLAGTDLKRHVKAAAKGAGLWNGADAHTQWSMDSVARSTLGRGKVGKGAEAPGMYQRGEWCQLLQYNIADVQLLADLWSFATTYGYVVGGDSILRLPALKGVR